MDKPPHNPNAKLMALGTIALVVKHAPNFATDVDDNALASWAFSQALGQMAAAAIGMQIRHLLETERDPDKARERTGQFVEMVLGGINEMIAREARAVLESRIAAEVQSADSTKH